MAGPWENYKPAKAEEGSGPWTSYGKDYKALSKPVAVDPSEGGGRLQIFNPFGPNIETPIPTNQGVERFLAGGGKALFDIGRGVGQITSLTSQADIDEAKRLDTPLMKTGAGMAGNLIGNVAALAPTAFIPGVNTYTGSALLGGALGAINPVASNESRTLNTALGAGAGVAGQAIGRGLGRLIAPVTATTTPEHQALAQQARNANIPLTVGQETGSRPLQIAESVMENLPFTAGRQLGMRQQQQTAFNRAVLDRAGISADAATAPVLSAQKRSVGGAMGDIAERNNLNFNAGLTDRLASISDDAATHLPPDMAARVSGTIDRILSQVDSGGVMAGTNYQGWREPLRKLATDTQSGHYFGQIRSSLDDAFRRQLGGDEAALFGDLSRQYRNVKTITDAMANAGAGTKLGNISPAALEGAVTRNVGREGKALGRGDLTDLVGVGRQFVSENIPNSGTAQRTMIQNMLTLNAPGVGVGGLAGYAQGGSPESAMMGAGLGLLGGIAAPRAMQSLMTSPAGREYLSRGLLALTPAERDAISNASRTGLLGLGLSLNP